MKRRILAMALAALLSLGVVACEGGTATDDTGATDPALDPVDPGADPLEGGDLDDGTLDGAGDGTDG